MEIKAIPYGGSKAVKITEVMRRDLNSYNQRKQEVASFEEEIAKLEQSLNEKKATVDELNIQASSEDKKEAKDAAKKIKAEEKEINKIDDNIKRIQDKMKKLTDKQNKVQLVGVVLNSFPKIEDINLESKEIPVREEVSEVAPEVQTPEEVTTSEIDMPVENEINTEMPSIEEAVPVGETTEESATSLENDEQSGFASELDDDFASELDDDFEIDESTDNNEETSEKETIEPTQITPDYSGLDDEADDNSDNPLGITEDEANQIWEGLQNVELYNKEIPTTYDEPQNYELITEPSAETTVVEETKIPEEVAPIIPEKTEEEVKEEVRNDIEQSIPIVEVQTPVNTENVMNQVYNEVGVEPEEEPKERDLKNLTLFKDYADYVFTFGQKHYEKDALTPSEIEALDNVKDFLSEKSFENKRTTQYKKIDDENKKLKKKVVTLGKEFTKNVDSISAEYSAAVEELTEMAEAAKEQAEADRVEKIQTQKLNDSLTDTIKEQSQTIEDLTNQNTDLQSTIESQNSQIADLEKQNEEQAARIRDFEEKLNTVFGIVKEVSN